MKARTGMILTTILGLGWAGCSHREAPKASEAPVPAVQEVRTAAVMRSGAASEVAVPAVVQARQHAALSARMPASVTDLPYQEGQWVQAGAVVVRLDDAALRAAVAAAEAGVTAAESDLARTKVLLDKGASTPRELEQMAAAASVARAQLTGARDSLSYTALRAPFSGRIAARRANLGDVVNPGTPLIEIEGEGGLELQATIESELAASLRPGSRLRALVDGQASPLAATLTAIAPAGDPTTHRFELKAELPAAPGLRAGLFARLLVPGIAADPRLMVPGSAVFERGGLAGVFVVENGKARLRWVAAGARQGDRVEVRAGVEPGERVALLPAPLADGTPVRETPVAELDAESLVAAAEKR